MDTEIVTLIAGVALVLGMVVMQIYFFAACKKIDEIHRHICEDEEDLD